MSTPKRKPNNAGKVMAACEKVGITVDPHVAQYIVNIMTNYGCKIIERFVNPGEIIALLQDYLKSLEPTGKYLGSTDQIYDEDKAGQRRGEIKQKKDKGFTKLIFKKE